MVGQRWCARLLWNPFSGDRDESHAVSRGKWWKLVSDCFPDGIVYSASLFEESRVGSLGKYLADFGLPGIDRTK